MRIGVDIGPLRLPFTGVANFELFLLDSLLREQPNFVIEGFGRLRWAAIDRDFLRRAAERAEKTLDAVSHVQGQAHRGADPATIALTAWKHLRALDSTQSILRGARRISFEYGSNLLRFNLFHAFNYCPPGRAKIPIVPVVYDLSCIRYPQMHPTARVRGMEHLGKHLTAAPVIHTISEFTASEISDVFGIERSRIVVTYPGVAPIYRAQPNVLPETLSKFGLVAGNYALTVATLEPRKNLRTLVTAFSRLTATVRKQMPLCVVGGQGWGKLALPPESRQLQLEQSLRFLGYTSDAQLRHLYAGARVVFYPSLYEGFGMPVIEAMACGAPVVASAASAIPEAIGKLGPLVNPFDTDAWTNELFRAANDKDYRNESAASERRAHALSFTWQRAAKQTIQMYERITREVC